MHTIFHSASQNLNFLIKGTPNGLKWNHYGWIEMNGWIWIKLIDKDEMITNLDEFFQCVAHLDSNRWHIHLGADSIQIYQFPFEDYQSSLQLSPLSLLTTRLALVRGAGSFQFNIRFEGSILSGALTDRLRLTAANSLNSRELELKSRWMIQILELSCLRRSFDGSISDSNSKWVCFD